MIRIGSLQINVPRFVTSPGNHLANSQTFERASFYTREEYQAYMHAKFNLGAGIPLIIRADAAGRWIESDNRSRRRALIRFNFQRESCKLSIRNITEVDLRRRFSEALNELPDKCDESTYDSFERFFLTWGTHVVSQVSAGGIAHLDCAVDVNSCSRNTLFHIEAEVSGIFHKLRIGGGGSGELTRSLNRLTEMGVSIEKFEFIGGLSTELISLETLTQEKFNKWLESVDDHPTELQPTITLEPYYNFVEGRRSASLRSATTKYLSKWNAEVEQQRLALLDRPGLAIHRMGERDGDEVMRQVRRALLGPLDPLGLLFDPWRIGNR